MDYKLEAMVLSASRMEAMVDFYTNVFGIDFEVVRLPDLTLYNGKFSGLDFTLVPAAANEIKTPQNPTHYDIYVSDVHKGIELVTKHGGRTNGRLGEDESEKAIGIYDPDGNFMVFKQRK